MPHFSEEEEEEVMPWRNLGPVEPKSVNLK